MSVTYIEHPDDKYFELIVDGRIGKEDVDRVMPRVRAFMAAHGEVSVLQIIRSLGFVNVPAAVPYIGVGIAAVAKVRRAALVTDLIWLRRTTVATSVISPIRTQVFALADEAAARSWLTAPDNPAGPAA